jgi:hypothetical protein
MSHAFIPLFDPMASHSYVPLIDETRSCCPDWLISIHRLGGNKPVHSIGCHVFNDLVVSGRGHLFHRGLQLQSRDVLPKYWFDLIERGIIDLEVEKVRGEVYVDDPCIVCIGHGGTVYGHVLLEMLLRFQVARSLGLGHFKILLYDKLAPWVVDILRQFFGVPDNSMITYRRDQDRVRLRTAIIPTLLHTEDDYHPAAVQIQADMSAKLPRPPHGVDRDRILISRLMHKNINSLQRHITNIESLWHYAKVVHGFEIVHPEQLSWDKQVELFSRAKIVLGEYGSALHNALFSPKSTVILSVGVVNLHQSALGALRGHRQAFFTAFEKPEGAELVADLELFKTWLDRLISVCDAK